MAQALLQVGLHSSKEEEQQHSGPKSRGKGSRQLNRHSLSQTSPTLSQATATAEQRDKNCKWETKLLREKRRELRSDYPKDKKRKKRICLLFSHVSQKAEEVNTATFTQRENKSSEVLGLVWTSNRHHHAECWTIFGSFKSPGLHLLFRCLYQRTSVLQIFQVLLQ